MLVHVLFLDFGRRGSFVCVRRILGGTTAALLLRADLLGNVEIVLLIVYLLEAGPVLKSIGTAGALRPVGDPAVRLRGGHVVMEVYFDWSLVCLCCGLVRVLQFLEPSLLLG